jgi:hypothetical protein
MAMLEPDAEPDAELATTKPQNTKCGIIHFVHAN